MLPFWSLGWEELFLDVFSRGWSYSKAGRGPPFHRMLGVHHFGDV